MTRSITHTTRYTFGEAVSYTLQKLRLRPQSGPLQDVQSWDVVIKGGKIEVSYHDHYGNAVDLISADIGATELVITASGTVNTIDKAGVLGPSYGRAPLWHFVQNTALTTPNDAINALGDIAHSTDTTLNGLHLLSAAILEAVPYETGITDATTTAAGAIIAGKGVCQDHTHIFLSAARQAGIPARYVSGYLQMSDRIDQEASHAWAEAHIDGLGWVGFDVSNGVSPDSNYIRIATGRDASDAAPVSGLRMGSGSEAISVSVQVQQ